MSVLPPTVFHGSAFSSGSLVDLVQNLDVVIQGPSFEKAMDMYTRRIKTELFAADSARSKVGDVKVYCKAPSRKKGDPDTVKSFTASSVRHVQQKKAFGSTVKSSTVAHRCVTLEMLFRTTHFKSDGVTPNEYENNEADDFSDSSMTWKFVRVKRSYTLHFQDKPKDSATKPTTTRSFAELPGISLAVGVFVDPDGESAALNYMALFSTQLPQAQTARKKKVLTMVVEEMGKKESDGEAVEKATELICGGGVSSAIHKNPLFDSILDKLRKDVREAVAKRDDFRTFSRCLPICLLCGKKGALRDIWRMLCGNELALDAKVPGKQSSKCGTSAFLNLVRNDGSTMADACRYLNEMMMSLLRSEKDFFTKPENLKDEKKREEHKSHVQGTLDAIGDMVAALQSMFWNWNIKILELAAAEAGSDAAGLDDVFHHLLGEVGDVASRKMRMTNFPPYELVVDSGDSFANVPPRQKNESADSSASSDLDSDEEIAPDRAPPSMPKLNETACRAYAESLRVNMKVLKRLTGLLVGLERCAGMDVASLCVQSHEQKIRDALSRKKASERAGGGQRRKSVSAAEVEAGNFFQKMNALDVVTAIGVLEDVIRGPKFDDRQLTQGKPAVSAKVAPGDDSSPVISDKIRKILFSVRWTFDRQRMRELDPDLCGTIIDIEKEAMAAARNRNVYAAPIAKEGAVMQYLIDSRVDQALSKCFETILGGALVPNPFPKVRAAHRSTVERGRNAHVLHRHSLTRSLTFSSSCRS